jgi:hypothetical protein
MSSGTRQAEAAELRIIELNVDGTERMPNLNASNQQILDGDGPLAIDMMCTKPVPFGVRHGKVVLVHGLYQKADEHAAWEPVPKLLQAGGGACLMRCNGALVGNTRQNSITFSIRIFCAWIPEEATMRILKTRFFLMGAAGLIHDFGEEVFEYIPRYRALRVLQFIHTPLALYS